MNIAILAAGQGKRMNSSLPKVLHHLAGRPMLQHVIDQGRLLSPTGICIVYGHGGEQVPQVMAAADLKFAKQEPQLGTGHALAQALPHFDAQGITVVLYGDVPLVQAATLKKLFEVATRGQVALLTIELANPKGYGRIVRDNGTVKAIVEEKDASVIQQAITEVNTGIMAAPTGLFRRWLGQLNNNNAQGEYYLTDIVAMAVAESVTVEAIHPDHEWEVLGVNSKSQLAELERIYQHEYAKALLEQGVSLYDPARIDVRGELVCGRDVTIDVNCVFEGAVYLEDGVYIGPNCVLKNAVVKQGTSIAPFSHIDGAEIGANNRIGPFARLRPGTQLAEDVHIGNFVEVKNTTVAAGSKANHLAYLGDSTIGKNVNIGAGTITCNYDGVNKSRTVIEDDVFIGSDTQLIAPVTVGRGATIGAGTTVTQNAPPDTLTVSRVRQVSIPGWKRPTKITK